MTSGKKSQVLCGFRHLTPRDKWQTPNICWVFGPLVTFPIFGRGATCPPYDLKSQKGQIEGIIRFYAASATCQGDKLKWTPTCQGTNCGARMFPGFLLNLSLFLSLAGGQLWLALSVTATPCQLPQGGSRVSSPPGVCRKPSLASPFGGRWCPVGTVQRLTEPAGESALQGRAERAFPAAPGAHVRWPLDEHERSELPLARIDSGGTPPAGKNASLFP